MQISYNQYWQLLVRYLQPQRARVLLLSGLLFGDIGVQLLGPQIVRRFIDLAEVGAALQPLLLAAGFFLGAGLLQQGISIAATYVSTDIGWRATNTLRANLLEHCLNLDMPFHNTHTPGELIERIDGDVDALNNFFSSFILLIVGNILLCIGILIALYIEDWRLGVWFTLFVIIALVALRQVEGRAAPFWEIGRQASADLYGFIEAYLGGLDDIRANGAQGYVLNRFFMEQRTYVVSTIRARLAAVALWKTIDVLLNSGTIIALALGVYLYQQGNLNIGGVYLITHYSALLRDPLGTLSGQVDNLQRAAASIARVQKLLDLSPSVKSGQNSSISANGTLAITFENVSFTYAEVSTVNNNASNTPAVNDQKRTLEQISFSLKPGHVLGLIGRTGSGKTTISRLLMRLYDPQKGNIRIGNIDIRTLALDTLRQKIGLVTQDVQLFQGTLRDNLTLFDETVSDQHILTVIDELGLTDWLTRQSNGLNMQLDAQGSGLSAGEAQLLALTRVFLRNPEVVILDEASSRLDPATEQLLQHAITRLLENRTGIIIAHRLSTVQRADEIMILANGRVVEYGERLTLSQDSNSQFAQLMRQGIGELNE